MASSPDRKSHATGEGGFACQLFIEVNLDLLLRAFFDWCGALTCCALLLDLWVLPCSFRSHEETQPITGMTRPWGLEEDDEDCLQHFGEGLWCHLNPLLPLDWKHCICDPDCLGESLPLAIWWPLLPMVLQRMIKFAKWNSPRSASYSLRFWSNLSVLWVLWTPCRLALDICLFNSYHNSLMHSSYCWWESMLGARVHSPCLATWMMASSVAPQRALTEGCSGVSSSVSSLHDLWECLWCSFIFMEAA